MQGLNSGYTRCQLDGFAVKVVAARRKVDLQGCMGDDGVDVTRLAPRDGTNPCTELVEIQGLH